MHFYAYTVKWYYETELTTNSGIVISNDFDEAIQNIMKSFDDVDSISLDSLNWDFKDILPLPNNFIEEVIKATNEGC